jgi:DNA-binding NtrC family response regulator/predicted negative regulator of RcsB-dependent stress response
MTWFPLLFHRFRDAIRRGDLARSSGRFTDAITAYREALEVRGEDLTPDQEAHLCVRTAECHIELGDYDAAEEALTAVENLDPRRILPGTRGALHCARGYVALGRGRYEDTVREGTEAWEILRNTGENTLLARTLNCRGHGLRRLGRLSEAHQDYTDAMAAARRAGNDHEVGLAASNLGFLLWQSGRYQEARAFHRRAVEIHETTGSDTHLTRELFALSVDEFHCGNWNQVDALLDRCAERAAKTQDRRLEVAVEISRGRLALYRGQDCEEILEVARGKADESGYAHDLIVIGQLLGEAAMEHGEWEKARGILLETLARARKASPNGEPCGDTMWRLARAEEALGDPEGRVLATLEQALENARSREFRSLEAHVRRVLGFVLARRGRNADAREHFEYAVDTFRELRMPFEEGRSLLMLGRHLAEDEREREAALAELHEAAEIFVDLGAEGRSREADEALAAAGADTLVTGAIAAVDADPFREILTRAPVMEDAIRRSRRIAPSDIPILLSGETGTGKELFARAIHLASRRRGRPFLAVNCAALTETLLESELFGHVQGAFTGATADKKGIFEAADGGTVFLDEIGKAPRSLQSKLLRVLDTGEVRKVGGVEASRVSVRIIAATNGDLKRLVSEEAFLPDLLYRLRGYEIVVPPLRERTGDIAYLFEKFALRAPTRAALKVLERYYWPGNVREIRNLAESAAFLTFGRGPIPLDALPDWLRESSGNGKSARLEETEREAVMRALEEAGGNRSRAARALGISRQTLYTKMSKYGIGRKPAAAERRVSAA